MKPSELMEKFPEEFKMIGAIFVALGRIDIYLIVFLTSFYTDISNPNSEKTIILNDALFDEKIFPSIENRRRLLIKIIKNISRVAEEKKIIFNKEYWLDICESIKKVQEVRNRVGHKIFSFPGGGKISYQVRKTNEERLNDAQAGKPGTLKIIDIDLRTELDKAENVCRDAEKFGSELLPQVFQIVGR